MWSALNNSNTINGTKKLFFLGIISKIYLV